MKKIKRKALAVPDISDLYEGNDISKFTSQSVNITQSNPKKEYEGCFSLWSSVVELILSDLIKGKGCSKAKYHINNLNYYRRKEAIDLIFGVHKHYFEDICSLIDLDAQYIKRKIIARGLVIPEEIGFSNANDNDTLR